MSEMMIDEAAQIGAHRADPRRRTLDAYTGHLERHGPEAVLETAQRDLTATDLAKLTGYIEHKQSVEEWKRGAWVPRRIRVRQCACGCGLDLPANAASTRLYRSEACRARAARQRHGNQGGLEPDSVTRIRPAMLGQRHGDPGGSDRLDQPAHVAPQSRDVCQAPGCGRELSSLRRADSRFCSDRCRQAAHRAKEAA